MKSAVFVMLVSGLVTQASFGHPICNTLDDCLSLQGKVEARIKALQSSRSPKLGGFERDGGGNILIMNQYDADKYCKNQGGRLPTIRELATWATQYGAKISNTPQNGYDEIDGSNTVGKPDKFYFQYSEYKAPSGNLGRCWYWSSSVSRDNSNFAYVLLGAFGYATEYDRSHSDVACSAVRCMR